MANVNKSRGTIAILTGGGDVPGLNPAIRGVTVRALREGGSHVVVGTCPDLGIIKPVPQPLRSVMATLSRRLAAALGPKAASLEEESQDIFRHRALSRGVKRPPRKIAQAVNTVPVFNNVEDTERVNGKRHDAAFRLVIKRGGEIGRQGRKFAVTSYNFGDDLFRRRDKIKYDIE